MVRATINIVPRLAVLVVLAYLCVGCVCVRAAAPHPHAIRTAQQYKQPNFVGSPQFVRNVYYTETEKKNRKKICILRLVLVRCALPYLKYDFSRLADFSVRNTVGALRFKILRLSKMYCQTLAREILPLKNVIKKIVYIRQIYPRLLFQSFPQTIVQLRRMPIGRQRN